MATQKETTQGTNGSTAVAILEKNIAENVLNRIKQFTANKDIRLPADYSPENALKSAWLILLETKTSKQDGERPVLDACTKESIANTLLNMVLQGLNPVKKQCDFIAYGNKLTLQREYHGTVALAKRYGLIKEPVANIIYEGDEFEYSIDERGYRKVDKHIQKFENIDNNKIKGAYATLLFQDENRQPYIEIMTMQQIRQAWNQGATKGASPAHKNFPDEMAKKTVIGRACKLFITSSDDSALFEDPEADNFTTNAREQMLTKANQEEITIDVQEEQKPQARLPKAEKMETIEVPEQQQPDPILREEKAERGQPKPNAVLFEQSGPNF